MQIRFPYVQTYTCMQTLLYLCADIDLHAHLQKNKKKLQAFHPTRLMFGNRVCLILVTVQRYLHLRPVLHWVAWYDKSACIHNTVMLALCVTGHSLTYGLLQLLLLPTTLISEQDCRNCEK